MKLKYTTDICGNDLLTDDSENHQIMMEWEKPYMEYSINMLKPFGRVLEIGFGMGYSATKICEFNAVTEYNVVECSPVVWKKFELWRNEILKKRPELKIEIIKGRWEDVLCKESNGSYDSIYFDDYNGELVESISRFPRFFYKIIKDHIKIGSKICSYCTKNHNSFDITNAHYECFEYNIDIPQYCKYAKGDKMYVPIWTIVGIISVEEQEKILQPTNPEQKKFKKQALKAKEYYDKPKSIYCNLLVIDNFYIDAKETREYILKEEFKVRGNYPGQRTTSKANIHLKEMIQGYIQHFAGKIIDWPMPSTNNNNGQNNNDTYKSHSFDFGIVTMTQEYLHYHALNSDLEKRKKEIKKYLNSLEINLDEYTFVATAGTPTTVAAVKLGQDFFSYDKDVVNGTIVNLDDLQTCLTLLSNSSKEEITKLVGRGRVEFIEVGIFIYQAIYEVLGKSESIVLDDGLREGVAINACLKCKT